MAIPPVPPNAVFSVTIEGDLVGQQVMNVLHYQYRGDATAPHEDVMAALQQLIEAPAQLLVNYRSVIPDNLTNIIIRYQRIWPVRYAQEVEIPAQRTGLRDSAKMSNLAAVITKQCEEAGRANVGTLHIPGLNNEDMEDGFLVAGFKALCDVLADQILQAVAVGPVGSKLVPVLWRRSDPANCPQVVNAFTQDTIRVMRRRTVRVGS